MTGRAAFALGLVAVCANGAATSRAQPPPQDSCVACHRKERDAAMREPVEQWRESVHARAQVSCDGCHGGDPRERSLKRSMSVAAGFLENPSWREMADYCGVCHEALSKSWLEGSLGRAMRAGVRVPSCATCHMPEGHRIEVATPAHLDVAGRCRTCTPVEDAAGAASLLRDLAEQRRVVGEFVGRAESRGSDASDLSSRIRDSREAFALALHRFEPAATGAVYPAARSELASIRATAEALIREAARRRRYGLAVLFLLSLLFAGLVTLRRRLA